MCLSSEVKIIFSCPWLEGFTITLNSGFAPLPPSSGLVKCQRCPETKNSDTSFSSPHPCNPKQFPSVVIGSRCVRSHSSAFTVCCFLPVVKIVVSTTLECPSVSVNTISSWAEQTKTTLYQPGAEELALSSIFHSWNAAQHTGPERCSHTQPQIYILCPSFQLQCQVFRLEQGRSPEVTGCLHCKPACPTYMDREITVTSNCLR